MMDFDRKHFVMQRIAQNGTMYQQLMMAQQQVVALAGVIDELKGTNYAQQFAQQMQGGMPMQLMCMGGMPTQNIENTEALGGDEKGEASNTKKARQRVADSTSPA
jgi:hypothetical protein